MGHGGKRANSGRKKGSTNKSIDSIRNELQSYEKKLLKKAVDMALDGNVTVLNKLLDKILPNLNSVDTNLNPDQLPEIKINVIGN